MEWVLLWGAMEKLIWDSGAATVLPSDCCTEEIPWTVLDLDIGHGYVAFLRWALQCPAQLGAVW